MEESKKQDSPIDANKPYELLRDNYDFDRKRSSSFNENLSLKNKSLIVKKGIMKKKGLLFYNNRVVQLNVKGILSYYDPKNLTVPRG